MVSSRVERYHPVENKWQQRKSLNVPRIFSQIVQVNSSLLVLGGATIDGEGTLSCVETVEKYSPTDDTWTVVCNMLTPRAEFGCCLLEDSVYVAGGYDWNNTQRLSSVESLDLATMIWTTLTTINQPLTGIACCSLKLFFDKSDRTTDLIRKSSSSKNNDAGQNVKDLMDKQTHVPCGPCAFKNERRKSTVWCPSCGEGLCDACLLHHKASAASRKHQVIVKDLHRIPSVLFSMRQTCLEHGFTFDLYCNTHEVPLCSRCIAEHKRCLKMLPISYVARNSKFSTKLWDIEHGIANVLGNVEEIIRKKEENLESIKEEKTSIEEELKNLRTKINMYMDNLQEKVLNDISSVYSTVSLETENFLSKLGKRKRNIENIAQNLACIREYASDLQTFLLTEKLEMDFIKEQESFVSDMKDTDLEEVDIHVTFNSDIYSLLATVTSLAEVDVIRHKATLWQMKKEIENDFPPVNQLENIRLLCRTPIITPRESKPKFLRNCVILENKEVLFTDDSESKRVIWFNSDGSYKKNIEMRSEPYDIVNHDVNKIAVTVPREKSIFIFDLARNKIAGRITTKNFCYGLCSNDDKFLVSVFDQGIQTIDFNGKVLQTVPMNVEKICNIHMNASKLYFTEYDTSTVTCCDLYGNCIWKFRHKSFGGPLSISTDTEGNVYAVGYDTDNLILISADGRQCAFLLEEKDKLFGPTGIFLDKQSKQLLVCSRFDGHAVLYDLVT